MPEPPPGQAAAAGRGPCAASQRTRGRAHYPADFCFNSIYPPTDERVAVKLSGHFHGGSRTDAGLRADARAGRAPRGGGREGLCPARDGKRLPSLVWMKTVINTWLRHTCVCKDWDSFWKKS